MKKVFFLSLLVFLLLGIPLSGMVAQRGAKMASQTESGSVPAVGMAVPANMARDAGEMEISYGKGKMEVAQTMIAPMPAGSPFMINAERSVIRTASLAMQVEDPAATVSRISTLAIEFQGLVTNSNVYDVGPESGAVMADLTLRVPSAKLNEVMQAVKNLGTRVVSESVNANDQTEQRVDLEAQLKNLRAAEAQFLSLLSKAKTVEETLQVQQQVNQTRSQIERMDAQLQSLKDSVAMSTLSVNLSTKADSLPLVDDSEPSLREEIKAALRATFRIYRGLFVAGVTLLIVASPLFLLGAVVVAIVLRKRRK